MNINDYIKTRVDNQISWYDKKSLSCQWKYKIFQIIEIVLAACIPLLSAYSQNSLIISIIIGCFGALITIIESITKLCKWHENWIEYRTTCELLRYQKYLFETKSAPYNNEPETTENIFIRNVENIISSENNKWKTIQIEDSQNNTSN